MTERFETDELRLVAVAEIVENDAPPPEGRILGWVTHAFDQYEGLINDGAQELIATTNRLADEAVQMVAPTISMVRSPTTQQVLETLTYLVGRQIEMSEQLTRAWHSFARDSLSRVRRVWGLDENQH